MELAFVAIVPAPLEVEWDVGRLRMGFRVLLSGTLGDAEALDGTTHPPPVLSKGNAQCRAYACKGNGKIVERGTGKFVGFRN